MQGLVADSCFTAAYRSLLPPGGVRWAPGLTSGHGWGAWRWLGQRGSDQPWHTREPRRRSRTTTPSRCGRFNDLVAADRRVQSVILPVADGLTLIRKL